jgi:Domain of unknown function (DUF4159)
MPAGLRDVAVAARFRSPLRFGAILLVAAATTALGQRSVPADPQTAAIDDDSEVTFVRLRWRSDGGGFRGGGAAWNHDTPRAEQHLSLIVNELTLIDMRSTGLILTLDDPALCNYPIAYMWEPGFWNLTDREAAAFRAYLLKGGFAVFEDFDGDQQWATFEAQMRRVLPEGRLVRIDGTHPIFDAFFRVQDIDSIVHPMYGLRPSYYGIFEDNDPNRRLMVMANFDNDVPEYWEWSGRGIFPFDMSNEAYKLGVNYMVYGLTH